jgi:hypothetical protein
MGVVLAGLLATLLLAACGSPSSTAAVATTSPSTTLQPTTSYTTTTVPIASPSAAALTCDSPSSWAIYDGNGVRFDYPSCWTPVHNVEVSTMSSSLVDLSNEAMQDPCTTTASSTACGWPLTKLAAEGVLVRWSSNGFPGWSLQQAPGTSLTVGGLPAREQVSQPGNCGSIGADETIAVEVARTVPSNYYAMTACLRGPDQTQAASQVQQILASTTFTNSG